MIMVERNRDVATVIDEKEKQEMQKLLRQKQKDHTNRRDTIERMMLIDARLTNKKKSAIMLEQSHSSHDTCGTQVRKSDDGTEPCQNVFRPTCFLCRKAIANKKEECFLCHRRNSSGRCLLC